MGRVTSRTRHHRRRSVRRRRLVAAVVVGLVAGGSVLGFVLLRDTGVERFCGRPEELRTRGNVTLTADAMDAFREAEAAVDHEIVVVESYRTCREQALACERICGTRGGCPDLCAPPGLSWHQRALAIDVTQDMLDAPGVIDALEGAGWCQPLPASDPGHFSYDGCH